MDKLQIETQKSKLVVSGREFGGEQPLDIRVTLPEYLGDVVRVLRCSVDVIPGGISAADDRITADGTARAQIVYLSDGDGVCAYGTAEPFTKSVEAPALSAESSILPSFQTDKPICRAVSPRTLEIKTTVRMSFRVCDRRERTLIREAKGGGVCLKTAEMSVTDVENVSSKQINVESTCDIPAEHNAAKRILCSDAACRVNETRVITNKAMVRGETEFSVFYLPDGSAEPETVRLTLPFSEIVDCAGLNDAMSASVRVRVLSHEVVAVNAKNAARQLQCSAVVSLTLTAEKTERLVAATDAFSTECELGCEYAALRETVESRAVAESIAVDGRIDLSRLQPKRILYHTERVENTRCAFTERGVRMNGTLFAGLFASSQDGGVCYAESTLDFTFEKTVPAAADAYAFSPAVTVNAAEVALDGGTATVRAELFVEGRLDALRERNALCGVELRKDCPKTAASGLVIYFPGEGEQLWDAAKAYGANPAMLREDNGLEDDALPAGKPLLIAGI